MKIKILSLLAAMSFASNADAAAITIGTGTSRGHQFVLSDGTTRVSVNPANTVRIGYLTTAGDSSTFVNFGTTTISNPLSTQPIGGFVTNQSNDNPAANGVGNSIIANQQLAIWVLGQNGDQGLFTSTSWVVPPSLGVATDQLYNLVLGAGSGLTPPVVTGVAITGFQTASTRVESVTVGATANPNGTTYQLGAAVPEPSVTALLGLLGLVGLRRKR
jgi:hypothetical protein